MPKKTNLAETFKVDATELQPKPELAVVESQPQPKAQPQQKPKQRHIGGYFNERVYQQWKFLAIERDMTSQAMLEEAFDLWFQINDKPAIAKK